MFLDHLVLTHPSTPFPAPWGQPRSFRGHGLLEGHPPPPAWKISCVRLHRSGITSLFLGGKSFAFSGP